MKAYCLSMKNDDDAGSVIVFAKTGKEAKKQIYGTTLGDYSWDFINIQVHRRPHFDGMENLSGGDLALQEWKDGWRWWDTVTPMPDEDNATDKEFLEWYDDNFKN